jgi:hypothetical protein
VSSERDWRPIRRPHHEVTQMISFTVYVDLSVVVCANLRFIVDG